MGGRGLAKDSKQARDDRAHLVLIDETGLFLNPLVRRSWSVCGKTPVIGGDGGHRTKVSVIGAVSVSPGIRRLNAEKAARSRKGDGTESP